MFSAERYVLCHACGTSVEAPPYTSLDITLADFNGRIEEAKDGISTLDEEITKLRKLVDQLEQRRKALSTFISHQLSFHRDPVYRFPAEVMSGIFHLVSQQNVFTSKARDSRKALSTMVLSHVNRLWRNFTVGSPSLWSRMLLILDPTNEDESGSHDGLASLLEMYIARSMDHSLKVQIRGGRTLITNLVPRRSWRMEDLSTCSNLQLSLLFDHDWHWESYEGPLEAIHAASTVKSKNYDFRRLLNLELYADYDSNLGALKEMSRIDYFRSAGALISVRLFNIPFSSFSFPCGSVESLNLDDKYLDPDHDNMATNLDLIASNMPMLRSLTVSEEFISQDFTEHFPLPSGLNALEELIVKDYLNFDLVTTPSLQKLVLLGWLFSEDAELQRQHMVSKVASLQSRSGSNITSLTSNSKFILVETFPEAVKSLTGLRRLHFVDVSRVPDHVALVAKLLSSLSSNEDQLAPRLEELLFEQDLGRGLNSKEGVHIDETLIEMLETRKYREDVASIKLLSIDKKGVIFRFDQRGVCRREDKVSYKVKCTSIEVEERLRALHAGGLKVCWNQRWFPVSPATRFEVEGL